MQNNKTPGNDEITKKFFVTFWDNIKVFFQNSWRAAKLKKKLSTSQRQTVIKLLERKIGMKDLLKTGGQYPY